MAGISEDDMAALMAEVDKKLNGMVKAVTEKVASRVAADMAKVVEEGVASKLAEATKAQAAAAAKPDALEEERKTVKQRVEALEKERDEARAAVKAQKTAAAFHKAWGGAKFQPELADEHMAVLEKQGRLLIEDDGTVRVKDPKKHPTETQQTVEEYIGELAKSDRGKFYQPARTSPGQGGVPVNGAQPGKREHNPFAVQSLLTGQTHD